MYTLPIKKIHRIREISQHGAKYKKTTMFYDMIVIRVCPRNRGATTNNQLCECILAQTSSRFLGLPKISFSDLPSWIRETARLIQQRSCAGFTPSFLRPFRRKIRKTLFNCNGYTLLYYVIYSKSSCFLRDFGEKDKQEVGSFCSILQGMAELPEFLQVLS